MLTFICLALNLVHLIESLNEYRVFNGFKVTDYRKFQQTKVTQKLIVEFPDERYSFLASLQYWHSMKEKFIPFASVTIISEKYGITAAHCVQELIRKNLAHNIFVLSNSPFSTVGTVEDEQIHRVVNINKHDLFVSTSFNYIVQFLTSFHTAKT